MNRWVMAAWMACAFVAGWLLREPLPPALATLPDGGVFTGTLQGGLMQGRGEIHWPDGSYYQGEFADGLYHGEGVFEYADGTRCEGEWRAGEFISAASDSSSDTTIDQRVEQALYSEESRLLQQLDTLAPGTPGQTELYFLGIAGDGTQRVFGREIDFVHQQLQQRYDLHQHSLLLINDRERMGDTVMASRTSIESALWALSQAMNPDEDVLLLYFTSHGSETHDLMLDQEGLLLPDLPAQTLQQLLDQSGIRWQVVIVSACFSGGVVPLLQSPDRLVMTSAAADRSSFGCSDDAELTYFGRALFEQAFPASVDWPVMFETAQHWIEQKESAEGVKSSQPQLAVGDRILPQLAQIPLQGGAP